MGLLRHMSEYLCWVIVGESREKMGGQEKRAWVWPRKASGQMVANLSFSRSLDSGTLIISSMKVIIKMAGVCVFR